MKNLSGAEQSTSRFVSSGMTQFPVTLSLAAALSLLGLAFAPFVHAAGSNAQSRYTRLSDCRIIAANKEEAGYVRSACRGIRGFNLERVEADGRDNLSVISPNGANQSLSLPSLSGGGFSSLGDTIEWRGRAGRKPTAAIIRYKVVEQPSQPDRPTSYLLVVSLPGKPCVAARIAPGPNQNERARKAADNKLSCKKE